MAPAKISDQTQRPSSRPTIFQRLKRGRLRTALQGMFADAGNTIHPDRQAVRIAVQCVTDALYFGLMAALSADMKAEREIAVDLIVTRSVSAAFGLNVNSAIRRNAAIAWLMTFPWIRSFGRLADGVGYRAVSWTHPLVDLAAVWQSFGNWRRWRQLKTIADVDWAIESIAGIVCGDLIIDTYLRFRPSPVFNVDDPFVWRLLWQTHRDVHRARSYFRRRAPSLYLTSYAAYIEHGIPVRAALAEGIAVYAFGDLTHFGNRLTSEYPTHVPDCRGYRRVFDSLPPSERERCRQQAAELLERRLSGGIDPATSYMRNSAYAHTEPDESNDNARDAVVVFLHDFFDSPHIWPHLAFTDFWEWICVTIETLDRAGIPYFIKPHPNQIQLSDDVVSDLKKKYPHSRWLDAKVNNAALASAPIACGVTVYGTIAHELAFLGVPSICAAMHPHIAFGFCRTARTRQEYRDLLVDYRTRPLPNVEMREQALEFYAIHNNLYLPLEAAAAAAFARYFVTSTTSTGEERPELVIEALTALRNEPAYKALVARMTETERTAA